MSSLWKMFLKADKVPAYPPTPESYPQMLQEYYRMHHPPLVNIQNIIDDFYNNESPCFTDSYDDITPCRQDLWMEWISPGGRQQRQAAAIRRYSLDELSTTKIAVLPPAPKDAKFVVAFAFLAEHQATPCLTGEAFVYIDAQGIPPEGPMTTMTVPKDHDLLLGFFAMVCEALCAMNTRGTHVEPPLDKPKTQVVKPQRAPFSIWHTIRLPKFAQPPQNLPASDETLERREHWVRAHRRDYRKGGGLFGRIHGLVWVPEFKRGNAELGTVKQSYEVHA